MNKLMDKFQRNKQWLIFALVSTFVWGLAAHAYGFLHDSFSHDSLSGFGGDTGEGWKISLGRFCVPVYKIIFRTELTLPWMVGLLSLVWIGLAVFLVIRIFRIESKVLAFLAAGIFTANITVTATAATYLHDLDGNMFGMLCTVAAVYLWKNVRWGELPGAVCIAVSMGLYQSYISVAIVLIIFVCILEILDGNTFKNVLLRGLRAVGMLLLGAVFYSVALKAALFLSGTEAATGSSNSLDNLLALTPENLVGLVADAYRKCYSRLMNVTSPYPAILIKGGTVVLMVISAAALLVGLLNQKGRVWEKLICLVLVGLLPLGMNITHVLSAGSSHDLMVYGIWLFYLLALLLADWLAKHLKAGENCFLQRLPKYICVALTFVLLYSNTQVANVLYLKKDMEQEAHLSMMTRVVYKMEDYDGYVPGETPVVLVGYLSQLNEVIPGFEPYDGITGAWRVDPIYQLARYRVEAYFKSFLANPVLLAEDAVWDSLQEDPSVAQMPSYPEDGCIAMIDGVMVVKLGEK